MSLASDIYDALYSLAMGALNPGYDALTDGDIPTIPVLKDQQAEAAPVPGIYVTIQGTPSLQRLGTVEHGSQAVDDSRNLDQLYVGDVVLWEVNGDGSSLHEIFAFSDTEEGMAIMDASPVSIMSYGDVVDMGMTLENRWIPQSRATISVSIKARNSETLSTIAEVHWANAENPANSGSVEYPTV